MLSNKADQEKLDANYESLKTIHSQIEHMMLLILEHLKIEYNQNKEPSNLTKKRK